MRESSEFLKAVAKNWPSPKDREKLVEEMRRKDAHLDAQIKRQKGWKADTDGQMNEAIAQKIEPVVYAQRRRGEISGGTRKILLSPTRS